MTDEPRTTGERKTYLKVGVDEVREILDEVHSAQSQIKELLQSIRQSLNDVNENAESVKNIKDSSEEAFQEVKSAREHVQSVNQEASQLSEEVENYRNTFSQFQSDLDNRNANYQNLLKNVQSLISTLESNVKSAKEDLETKIQGLKSALENSIESAKKDLEVMEAMRKRTEDIHSEELVIGLGASFHKKAEDLRAELIKMQKAYGVSLFLLFLSVLMVALMLNIISLPSWLAWLEPKEPPSGIGSVFVRSAITAPFILLVIFTSNRCSKLFALKEQYEYKYTMAFAVDGFQKQAGSLKHVVATAIFDHLTFNPIDKVMERKNLGVETTNKNMQAEVWKALKDEIEKTGST